MLPNILRLEMLTLKCKTQFLVCQRYLLQCVHGLRHASVHVTSRECVLVAPVYVRLFWSDTFKQGETIYRLLHPYLTAALRLIYTQNTKVWVHQCLWHVDALSVSGKPALSREPSTDAWGFHPPVLCFVVALCYCHLIQVQHLWPHHNPLLLRHRANRNVFSCVFSCVNRAFHSLACSASMVTTFVSHLLFDWVFVIVHLQSMNVHKW